MAQTRKHSSIRPSSRSRPQGISSLTLAWLLIGSGAAALVYQALWVKQVGLLVGVDVYAVTAVVSAFFAGLALGSAVLGARADVTDQPLRLYARIELGIALTAAGATLLLSGFERPYVALEDLIGRAAWLVPFVIIALPATLMGGTLPALIRTSRLRADEIGATSGSFYAANTLGGVIGVLAAPLLLIPSFGVRGAGLAAAGVNALLAAAAAWLARDARVIAKAPARAAAPAGGGENDGGSRLAIGLYALAGMLALGFEVVWSQAVVQFINTRTFAFALVLATYLLGLVIGSAVWARFSDRIRSPWRAFALLEWGVGASALLCYAMLGPWLPEAQTAAADAAFVRFGPVASAAVEIGLAPMTLLLAPTILMGAAFPAVARLACGPAHIGRDIGAVAALNTFGGIAGTLLSGFVLVPTFGLSRTIAMLATGTALIAAAAMLRGDSSEPSGNRRSIAAVLGVLMISIAGAALSPDHLGRLLTTDRRPGTLDFYEESAGGTVAVVKQPLMKSSFHRLYIHGISNSADHMMSRRYMRLQTLLPLVLQQGDSRSVLVVGLGTGITCGSTLAWPSLDRRVCAELLPTVVKAVNHFDANMDVGRAPGVNIRVTDGRHLLLREPATWDVITLEPPPPTAAGVVNLYSSDFYELCRERLAPGGIMAQWFPLTTQTVDTSRALVSSFVQAFPYASLWTTEAHEMLLVGSREPLRLDVSTIEQRMAQPSVRQALAEVGISDAASLLATYVTDRAGLEKFIQGALPATDDHPRLEYAPLIRGDEFFQIFNELFSLQTEPPLEGADDMFRGRMAIARMRLRLFYQALFAADVGRTDVMLDSANRVLAEEPNNPYFRFINELHD